MADGISEVAGWESGDGTFLFTSESVGEGHPDKLCDQVSDAVLDALLRADPEAKVACETAAKSNELNIFGEMMVHKDAKPVDIEQIARDTVKHIGFDNAETGMDYRTAKVRVLMEMQSFEIANAVHVDKDETDLGAGDQGMMFGYATDETPELMPLTLTLSHQLNQRLAEKRRNGTLPWGLPDTKTQVTIEYKPDGGAAVPQRVTAIVISTQHTPGVSLDKIKSDLMEEVIKPVVPPHLLTDKTDFFLNPSGSFLVGGPKGDAGLTGRKIIVDTYGGWGAHGGGAFSGIILNSFFHMNLLFFCYLLRQRSI